MKKSNLALLKKGEVCTVKQVDVGASSLRLMELGIVPGVDLKVVAVSPFGDPIAVELSNCCCVSLRKSDATQVLIEMN